MPDPDTGDGARRRGVLWLVVSAVTAGLIATGGLLALDWSQDRIAAPRVAAPSLEALPPSPIMMSVAYEASPFLSRLEATVPDRLGDLSERLAHPSNTLLQYAYQAERTPFEVEVRNGGVSLTTIIEYGGRVWYATPLGLDVSASCGISDAPEGPLRAVIRFSSPFEIAEDWTVHPRVRLDRIEPLTAGDRCRVAALGVELDVTDAIIAETERRLQEEIVRINGALSTIDLKPHVEAYWRVIQEPIALGDDAWLTLNPESFQYDGIEGTGSQGRTLRTEVSATTRPQVVLGPRPDVSDHALPPLQRGSNTDFPRTLVDGLASYDGLSELLTRELRGMEFHVAGLALELRRVTVTHAEAGRLAAEVEVEGRMSGRIRFTGTPVFDPDSNEVAFPDFDFRVESGSILARAYGWLLRTGALVQLRSEARLALDDLPQLHRTFAGLPSPPQSDGALRIELGGAAYLEGRLDEVDLVGLSVTEEGLLVRSRVDANTTVRVGEE